MIDQSILVVGTAPDSDQLCSALANLGFSTEQVADGPATLRKLRDNAYKACLIERSTLAQPNRESVGLMRALRREMAILLRGSGGKPEDSGLLLGVDDVLASSANATSIAERMQVAIERRRRSASDTKATTPTVLVVSPDEPREWTTWLQAWGFEVVSAATGWEGLALLRQNNVQLLLIDTNLDDMSYEGLIAATRRYDPSALPMLATLHRDLPKALSALGDHPGDILIKPVGASQLRSVTARLWQHWLSAMRREAAGEAPSLHPRVLLIESDHRLSLEIQAVLRDPTRGYGTHWASSLAEGLRVLQDSGADCAIVNLELTDSHGLATLTAVRQVAPELPVVVLSPGDDGALPRRVIQLGASDYVTLAELTPGFLPARVRNAIERRYQLNRLEGFVRDAATSHESSQLLLRHGIQGLVVLDEFGRVVSSNARAEQLVSGLQLGALAPAELNTPVGQSKEITTPASDPSFGAEKRALNVQSMALDAGGAPRIALLLEDCSLARKAERLEAQLHHSEGLATIGRLAAGVTHEINNTATYISANLSAIGERTHDLRHTFEQLRPLTESKGSDQPAVFPSTTEQPLEPVFARIAANLAELTEMIGENLEGMARIRSMTGELSAFSRVDVPRVELVDLGDVVGVACNFARNELRHRATLYQHLDSQTLVVGDRSKLTQVIINLLMNAGQAIVEGDAPNNQVVVKCKRLDGSARLEVSDTGVGMPDEIASRAFEPFFTTKSAKEGTGLGLSLCREIITQHGGRIGVITKPDAGSTFWVELPLARESAPRGERITRQITPLPPGLRILLIDDEPSVLRAYQRTFNRYEVHTALGGREGLERLKHDRHFDVVLCDLMMPDFDGPMLLEAVQREAPELVDRLVFCSGGAFTDRAREFVARFPRRCLQKPIERAAFEAAVKQVLAS